jgi:hypothetical protein
MRVYRWNLTSSYLTIRSRSNADRTGINSGSAYPPVNSRTQSPERSTRESKSLSNGQSPVIV